MRTQNIREYYVIPCITSETNSINFILKNIQNGGWEHWFQIQQALYIIKSMNNGSGFSREKSYPGSRKKYDLCVHPPKGANMYFEIKIQLTSADSTTANRFNNDIIKIKNLSKELIIVAYAISSLSNQKEWNNWNGLISNPNLKGKISWYTFNNNNNNLEKDTLTMFWYNIS